MNLIDKTIGIVKTMHAHRPDVKIEWFMPSQAHEIVALNRLDGLEVSQTQFINDLNRRDAICRVLTLDRWVKGYIVYRNLKTKNQILDVLIHPRYRFAGHGRHLVDDVVEISSITSRSVVARTNLDDIDSCRFFAAVGFKSHLDDRDRVVFTNEDSLCRVK